jgi:hypothetical protein
MTGWSFVSDAAPTRREDHPEVAPTVRQTGSGGWLPPTRREHPSPPPPGTIPPPPGAPAPHAWHAGLPHPLLAQYQPVRSLGAGGEAHVVMLVRERGDGTERVVKVYPTALRPQRGLLDALRRADPAHLVRVLRWGEYVDPFGTSMSWEVLEYLPGGSLARMLAGHGGRLPPELVREVVVEVAAALRYLHREVHAGDVVGFAHRDVKPENVLIRDAQPLRLVLCDFGLVTEARHTWRATERGGTPLYQAPETWFGRSSGTAQDWWSLGVMVVEMLTGRDPQIGPFADAADERVVFTRIATQGINLDGIGDPRWRLLCAGLLTPDPRRRWGADQVAGWLRGECPTVHERAALPESVPSGPGTPPGATAPAGADAPPFPLGGRSCTDPEQVARAMSEHWAAAVGVFLDHSRHLELDRWLREYFPAAGIPAELFHTQVTRPDDAAARVARFIAAAAPHLPPRFEGRAADATGVAAIAQAAYDRDAESVGIAGRLTPALLRTFAQHDCYAHAGCASGTGCAVLAEAAARLPAAHVALRERYQRVQTELLRERSPYGTTIVAGDLDFSVAAAALLRALVDGAYVEFLRRVLREQRAARLCPWWDRLRARAGRVSGDVTELAAAVLAYTLINRALMVAAARDGTRAQARAIQDDKRRARAQQRRDRFRDDLRALPRDGLNLLVALVMIYLTTYAVAALFELTRPGSGARTPERIAAAITARQLPLAVPAVILAGCALLRPIRPWDGARRARAVALGLAVGLAGALFGGYPEAAAFPVVLESAAGPLGRLGALAGSWLVWVALVAVPLALFLGHELARRAPDVRPAAPSPVRTLVKTLLVVTVLAGLLLRPLHLWLGWDAPGLPDPMLTWLIL